MSENNPPNPPAETGWERELIRELALESVREQRKGRRWALAFKIFIAGYLVVLLVMGMRDHWGNISTAEEYTAVIEVKGILMPDSEASADHLISALREAFQDEQAKGVVLRINSPGGSPVQAGYVYDEILRLKEKYPEKPIYAVAMDVCASGSYYIAAAADEIFVDQASLIGSIGVLLGGYGVTELMEKIGVERRLITAGEHKGMMDPSSPLSDFDRNHLKGMADQIHQQFIRAVRAGRGERLKEGPDTFSGLVWVGEEAVALGLADGLGSTSWVARERIGAEEIVDFTVQEDVLGRIGKQFGVTLNTLLTNWSAGLSAR